MKNLTIKTSLLGLTLSLMHLGAAQAQVAAPAVAKDPHPYLSQTLIYPTLGGTQAVTSVLRSFSVSGLDGKLKTLTSNVLYEQSGPTPTVIAQGGNFALLAGNLLQTVSAEGSVSTIQISYQIDQMGGMYFTKKGTSEIVVVDSNGAFFETGMIVKPTLLGGNFYISPDASGAPKITTFKSTGSAFTGTDGKQYKGWAGMPSTYTDDVSQVKRAGGNYFVNRDGTIGTIDSLNGYFYNNLVNDSPPAATGMGGNYFIGEDGHLYTVDFLGMIKKFDVIKVDQVKKLGYSYIEFKDETMIFIDAKGGFHNSAIEFVSGGSIIELSHLPAAGMQRDGAGVRIIPRAR